MKKHEVDKTARDLLKQGAQRKKAPVMTMPEAEALAIKSHKMWRDAVATEAGDASIPAPIAIEPPGKARSSKRR